LKQYFTLVWGNHVLTPVSHIKALERLRAWITWSRVIITVTLFMLWLVCV